MIVDTQTELASWFMSGIPPSELKLFVQELLQNGRRGEFIVRDITHRPDALGLLVKDLRPTEHRTFNIVQDKKKTCFHIEGAPEKFETIFMLIKFYAHRPRKSLGGIQLLLSSTSVLDSAVPHQASATGSIDDVGLDDAVDASTGRHDRGLTRTVMPLHPHADQSSALSDFDRWALNKKREGGQGHASTDNDAGTRGTSHDTVTTSSPSRPTPALPGSSVSMSEAKRRHLERIRHLAAEKIRMATAQTETLVAAQGPTVLKPETDSTALQTAAVDHRIDMRTVLQSNADNDTKLQAQAMQVELLRKERDLVAARLSAARATTSALRTRLGMPVAMEPRHRKIRRRPHKSSTAPDEQPSPASGDHAHPAHASAWDHSPTAGTATSPPRSRVKAVRFGATCDTAVPSEGDRGSPWQSSKRVREKTTSPSSPPQTETNASSSEILGGIQGLSLSGESHGMPTKRPSAKRKRVVSFGDTHQVVQFDESDAPSTEPLREVETPTHVEEPAGTEPIDEPHDNTVEPPHKGIRKRGVRTGLSAYERTRKPTYHAATAGSENTSEAIAESDEEDDGTIAPDTEGLTRDRSRTGSSIIISGARYLAGMEESGGIRQEEVERLQHTEAVERSRREMFDYRFRSASKKVDQQADDMSLAEFHARRFALAQQKEDEMKRRLKWDRAWDKRELKMLISRPDASDDLMTYLRDEAERETRAADQKVRRRSQDLGASAVQGIVSARASIFTH
eukprot:m.1172235 g.1172235  ORF g.1172235 m.1172235 type:complete len:737 (+) comp24516_c1_seq6:268-2478(+)